MARNKITEQHSNENKANKRKRNCKGNTGLEQSTVISGTISIHWYILQKDFMAPDKASFFFSVKKYCITKTHLFKYIENFTTKNENFQIKNSEIFQISAQNIDCGYLLELPR